MFLLDVLSDETFGYEADIFICAVAYGVTLALWRTIIAWCEVKLPGWEKFPKELQDRMSVESAILPIRFGLVYFSFPAVVGAFTSPENWKAVDTKNSLIACSLMTGSYLLDLSVHRDDILSIIHHCMGPALLLWIRSSFSSFDSSDAIICRPLMMFVFFGAGIGGTSSSVSVLLLRVGKKYLSSDKLYRYFAPCLLALTASTISSCYLNTAYLLQRHESLYGHFGIWYLLPVIWEGFECYLQWRWLLRFHEFERKFWDDKGDKKQVSFSPVVDNAVTHVVDLSQEKELGDVSIRTNMKKHIGQTQTVGSSIFPAWTVPALKVLTGGWTAMFLVVSCKLILSICREYEVGGAGLVAIS